MNMPPIVSPQEWDAAASSLVKEKELTRARDALAAERRRMPWMVEKDYQFEGPKGSASLTDLFEGRRQLIIYRAFYAPDVTTYAAGGAYRSERVWAVRWSPTRSSTPCAPERRDTTLAFVLACPRQRSRA